MTAPPAYTPPFAQNSLWLRARSERERLGYLPESTRECLSALGYTAAQIESGLANLRSYT